MVTEAGVSGLTAHERGARGGASRRPCLHRDGERGPRRDAAVPPAGVPLEVPLGGDAAGRVPLASRSPAAVGAASGPTQPTESPSSLSYIRVDGPRRALVAGRAGRGHRRTPPRRRPRDGELLLVQDPGRADPRLLAERAHRERTERKGRMKRREGRRDGLSRRALGRNDWAGARTHLADRLDFVGPFE